MLHRTIRYLNNFTEQSCRAIKLRDYPMRGFGNFASAASLCTAFDELDDYLMMRRRGGANRRWRTNAGCSLRVGRRRSANLQRPRRCRRGTRYACRNRAKT